MRKFNINEDNKKNCVSHSKRQRNLTLFIITAFTVAIAITVVIMNGLGVNTDNKDNNVIKIKTWNKYQNLQEKGIKDKKESTKLGKNVYTEREKELKKEIETEGGEFYAEQSYGKIKDFI